MALDKEYFDSIHIDIAKQKYYNANKVNALLDEIRTQAEALNAENERLRLQCEELEAKRLEISETLFSAQAIATEIINSAKAEAAEILAGAKSQPHPAPVISDDAQEYAVRCVEACMDKLRRQQLEAIDQINNSWREFLCGLMPDIDMPSGAKSAPAPNPEMSEDFVPDMAALEERVNAIAKGISDIMAPDEE